MLLLGHILNPLLMVLIPLVLGTWLVRKWRLDWAVFGFGAMTFIGSQVLHIPFNQLLLGPLLAPLSGEGWEWVVIAGAVGLSAGLFEELARYLVLRRIAGRVGAWREGVLFGLGHGGAEAIILGMLALYALFQAVALRGIALEGVVPPEQVGLVRTQLAAYWGLAWYEPLWATLERVSALAFHVMAATLVLMAVKSARLGWLLLAILAHTLLNAIALVALRQFGIAGTELILAGLGVVCVWVTFRLRPRLLREEPMLIKRGGPSTISPRASAADEIDKARLDQSRYL